jgi:type VI secretion system protein ImpJ
VRADDCSLDQAKLGRAGGSGKAHCETVMSWYSKVFWSEGLFLRPHHFQQNDRYIEHLVSGLTRQITPYPWGFSVLEIDRDLSQQSKFAVRRAKGIMPDGTPFAIPDDSPIPEPIDVPDAAAGQVTWLCMPIAAPNTREVDEQSAESASRYVRSAETFIDSTSTLRVEEEIDIAHPRLSFELRKNRIRSPDTSTWGSPGCLRFATATSCSTRNTSLPC